MVARHILTLWTNDLSLACDADEAGVDRIGLDLEQIGKEKRQSGRLTWISPHKFDDLAPLGETVRNAELFVRCNAIHDGISAEVDQLIEAGAKVLMLPNFTRVSEIARFVEIVDGRAKIVPLVERLATEKIISSLPDLGIEEIHVGLNDLSIDLGIGNRLKVLASPVLDRICGKAGDAGLRFGVGGLARALDAQLPVPSDVVFAQQARLGSTAALLARSFFKAPLKTGDFGQEIKNLRARLQYWQSMSKDALEKARLDLLSLATQSI